MNMNMKLWFEGILATQKKKAMPILSFPSISLLDVTVKELISDSALQARGMAAIAARCDTLASVGMMDLSVEAHAFGADIKITDSEVPTVIGAMIDDLEGAKELKVPEVGSGRTGRYIEAIEQACDLILDRPVFAGVIGPFSLTGRLSDLSRILVKCMKAPDMVVECMEKTTEFLIGYIRAYKEVGANGVLMAEPTSGLLSPKLIDKYSTPYVKQIVDAVQDDNFAVIYHNCGNTMPLIDSILKVGAYGYHFGNMVDMGQMLEKIPSDTVVMGNIDPSSQFFSGTPQTVYEETETLLERCGDKPNFVPSSGCDIPPTSPWENIDSFFEAADDYYRR